MSNDLDEEFDKFNCAFTEEKSVDVNFNRQLIIDIRKTIDLPTIGRDATSLLNNSKGSLTEREIIDDVKDILGSDNYGLLREFVEIAMVRGIIGYRYQIDQSRNASRERYRQDAAKKKQVTGNFNKNKIKNDMTPSMKKQHYELMKLTGISSKVDNE